MAHGERSGWTSGRFVCLAAVLLPAIAAYGRTLWYPFISDDYLQIRLGRLLADPDNWRDLLADPLYRCRATSLYLTRLTEAAFGLWPAAYYATSLALHVLNCLLVAVLLRSLSVSRPVAVAAAAFFAVYEGHQEAVIWYSAQPELLVLAFSLGALILWRRWCDQPAGGWRWYAGSLALFGGALASKESAVSVVPLLVWMALWRRARPWRAVLAAAAPFALLAAGYTILVFLARDQHLFFQDGTFTPSPRVLSVLPTSLLRMMFFWGALAAVILGRTKTLAFSLGWMVLALLPYSFITYMDRVPSRHTYFPSVGLALLAGAALLEVHRRWGLRRPWLVPALAAAIVAHNCVYLWTRKHDQYMKRAAPTEQLLGHIRDHRGYTGPVWVLDFPYDKHIVYSAVAVATEREPQKVIVGGEPPPAGAHTLRWDEGQQRLIVN